MKFFYQSLLVAASLFSFSAVQADDVAIKAALKKAMPTVSIISLKDSEIPGLKEVAIKGAIFYVSEDGNYLIQGHLFDLIAKKDITEAKLANLRMTALDGISEEKMIVFRPEKSKHTVSVFTDIDCGYCRKLHSEMEQYLAKGITVRYLFFPRAGKGSESYDKAVSVWCAIDRKKALTDAKLGTSPKKKTCDNPIDEHMALAEVFEVQGTPMIVTDKGTVLPGYVPADKLIKELERKK
ncbi:MAG: DsbC family protein [Methylococcales bacterium]|nr:DsbC family protein [Methylococcales bacterium]